MGLFIFAQYMPQRYSQKEVEVILRIIGQDVGFDRVSSVLNKVSRDADSTDRNIGKLHRTLRSGRGVINETTRAFSSMLAPLNSVIGLFAVGGLSYAGIIKYNYELNRSLLGVSRQFLKYGAGISTVERRIVDFANAHTMLKSEVISLASAYERGFISSGVNFAGFLRMLQVTVGNNADAMKEMAQQIFAVGQEYVGFQRIIKNVDESGRLSEFQVNFIKSMVQFGNASGRMSVQYRKSLLDILAAQERFNGEELDIDKNRREDVESQIDVARRVEKVVEDISIELNSRLMPALKGIVDLLNNATGFAKWAADIVVVGAAAGALFKTFQILSPTINSVGSGIAGFVQTSIAQQAAARAGSFAASAAPVAISAVGQPIGATISGAGISTAAGSAGIGAASGTGAVAASRLGVVQRLVAGGRAVSSGATATAGRVAALGTRSIPLIAAPAAVAMGTGAAFDAAHEGIYGREAMYGADPFIGSYAARGGSMTATAAMTGGAIAGPVGAAVGAVVGAGISIGQGLWAISEDIESARKNSQNFAQTMMGINQNLASREMNQFQERMLAVRQRMQPKIQELDAQRLDDADWLNAFNPFKGDKARRLEQELSIARAELNAIVLEEEEAYQQSIRSRDLNFRETARTNASDLDAMTASMEAIVLQEQNTSSQNQLLQDRIGLYSAISTQLGLIGDLSDSNLDKSRDGLELTRNQVDVTRDQLRALIDMQRAEISNGEQSLAGAVESISVNRPLLEQQLEDIRAQMDLRRRAIEIMPAGRDKDAAVGEYQDMILDEQTIRGTILSLEGVRENIMKSQAESQSSLLRNQMQYVALTQTLVNLERERIRSFYAPALDMEQARVGLVQAQISLADNLAMGLGASAEMRMQAVEQIGTVIDIERQKLAEYDRTIAGLRSDLSTAGEDERETLEAQILGLTTDRLNAETEIYNKQQQQASLLRALRDGYISSINAMNTGAGVFTKIIIDQNRNMGTLLRSADSVPVGIRTGSDVGGFRTSERFSPTGVSTSLERLQSPIVRPEWEAVMDPRLGFSGIGGTDPLSDLAEAVSEKIVERVGSMSGAAAGAGANYSNVSRLLGSPESTAKISMPQSNKREIVDTLTKEISKLIVDAVVAAKEDIMTEISNGIG